MKIGIRTDSSATIGTGHLMRCLTLADGLAQKGAEVHFICRDLEGHLSRFITEKGHNLHLLPAPNEEWVPSKEGPAHAAWLEVSWQRDLRESLEAAKSLSSAIDWLVVDHYALDRRWETGFRKGAKKILVIDDLADRGHDCDLLLDQNYFGGNDQRYDGLVPKGCVKLLGPRYALLRPEFRRARAFTKMRGNGVARVLVYFGGNDPDNLSKIALESLCTNGLRYLFVDIVVGPNHCYLDDLKRLAEKRGRSRLHVQPASFVELMLRADLCIGAGGTTTWERLCLGLPSIVITVASNQFPFTKALDKAGFIRYLGPKETVLANDIETAVIAEISKRDGFNELAKPNPVDGRGTLRVLEAMVPSDVGELTLRPADIDDMDSYFFWVNDPEVRKQSFHQDMVSWHDHQNWYQNKLCSPDTLMWVMTTKQGLPVGQIRFDCHEDRADISYSLDMVVRGRSWGKKLLSKGLKLFNSYQNKTIQGKVKKDNKISRRIFQELSFDKKIKDDHIVYYLSSDIK